MELKDIASIYITKLLKDEATITVSENDPQWLYLASYLPAYRNVFVLDAGCGNGRYMRKIRDMGYRNIFGVDLLDHIPIKEKYMEADISHLPIKDSSMDLVYSQSVIFYLPDPQKGLKEFYRVLKPNGILIITVHTKYSLFTLDRLIKRFLKLKTVDHLIGVRFYSSLEYKHMFDTVGFRLVEIDGFIISYIIWPVFRRIYNLLGIQRKNILNKNLSWLSKLNMNKKSFLRWIKSIICYHAVLVGCKTNNP